MTEGVQGWRAVRVSRAGAPTDHPTGELADCGESLARYLTESSQDILGHRRGGHRCAIHSVARDDTCQVIAAIGVLGAQGFAGRVETVPAPETARFAGPGRVEVAL